MRSHLPELALLAALGFLAAGCATVDVKLPLTRDQVYPADWPGIPVQGPQCQNLDGTYYNQGIEVDDRGSRTPVALSSLLERQDTSWEDRWARTGSVTLRVVTEKLDKNGDSQGRLDVVLNGDPDDPVFEKYAADFTDREMLKRVFCVKSTLVVAPRRQWGGGYIGWFGGGGLDLYLTKASDGSLVAGIIRSKAGLVLVVPYARETFTWARFEMAREP